MVKIAIIDDEALIRRGIGKIIEMSGKDYEIVGEAADGEDGFRLLIQLVPDIAIVDVKMPKLNGLDMIKKFRSYDSSTKKIHFIILSAYDDYAFTRQALKLDICDYLLKPVNRFDLLEQLEVAANFSAQSNADSEKKLPTLEIEKEDSSWNSINKASEYIQKNFYHDLSLSRVAEQVHMHPNYLGNLFKKKTGVSFLTYLTNVRIEKAKKLLDNPELKIYEICQIVGYYNPRHFSKLFKKNTNMTPIEYRDREKHM